MLKLKAMAPWRPEALRKADALTVTLPGLKISKTKLNLPGKVEVTVPEDAYSGFYYFGASSESSMPLWRVLRVE